MANTTNFGWETPDDTDLVKDGAAAMRTLGNSIDASFVDLKGGTTGQILSKNSNTDLDYLWINNDQGDITAVTAGTGITVTNGTGPTPSVALTIPVVETSGGTNQTTYATGDFLYASASNTLAKRTIGTTGQVLTVSSGVPTWATPASTTPTFVGCSLKKASGSTQTISTATYTKITFGAEVYDTDGFHDNVTNNTRITIPSGKAGKYLLTGKAELEANGSGTLRQILFYKNNAIVFYQFSPPSATLRFASDITYVFDAAVGDYFELALYQDRGSNLEAYDGDYGTVFQVSYLGA